MISRRRFLEVAGAGASALALAACTGSNDEQPSKPAEQPEEEPEEQAEPVPVRTTALKGPTAMGLVKFMSEVDAGNLADNGYSFQIVASPDEVTPLIAKGETDIAAVPANLASVLYNKTEKGVRVIAINTLGVLYICELGDSVQSVVDLKGKTIYASGKGSTPEYGLQYVLEKNGLVVGEDVQIEWKSEHAECVQAIATSSGDAVAMLPQPFVTTAQTQNDKIRVALDLTEEWDAVQTGDEKSSMITGVAIVRAAFADENPAAVDAFLAHYAESVDFVNDNVAEGAELVGSYDIVPAAVAEKAIPECNIVCVTGEEMKERLSGYLEVLAEQNPEAVGGAVPGDDFYYGA
ncbi:ABC transporter substrate-binding protein [Thermophilibacter provencensis]|uniref:ABC transporter substrate-binding protein n=1 Tax=Thermophilibacter provencensis TaxID=1852386 RepID=A0ABT7V208_9ACTN|nr:ABC transporter substrate-binding protein [Thermophilibacter provencensis]MDM8270634.1 ABC transporter substrate-binding protein [Thermophilibacter provencensis]